MLARQQGLIAPGEYLRAELDGDVKHEYVAGIIYAMAGAKNRHNQIAGNVFATLHTQLRGKPCRPYNSDTKVRIRLRDEARFYYPDAQVTCRPNDPEDTYQDNPSLVVEVLSDGTRRIDEGEKRDAYLALPSLTYYVLLETSEARAIAYRRTDTGFVRELYLGLDAVIQLAGLDAVLRLADVYESVDLTASND